MNKSVYLAGPISGLNYREATDWRFEVKNSLAQYGIRCLSPMRAEIFLRNHNGLLGDCQTPEELEAADCPVMSMSTPRGITTRDRFDALNCKVLFVNLLNAKTVSIGTVMEIAWADAMRTPVVLVMEQDNLHNHAMINESIGFQVDNVREGIAIVKAILEDY